ncbi:glycosyltransferase family 4 protein [Pseudooceanicola aestuarii]|uniref:glycosyltransferase family 4 protein n=1 Tax=Pseudooceanicola aestuarii TaxID=2697319 RepID=UPI0013D8D97A|nr:glycosyltransferase family 1 protein [Pseudooceanicola aestuarii]
MYHFDITDIAAQVGSNHTLAGIQRAALMIIRHAAQSLGPDNIRLIRHDARSGGYVACSAGPLLALDRMAPHAVAAALALDRGGKPPRDRADQTLHKYPRGTLKYRYHKARLDLEAARGNESYLRRRGLSVAEWRDLRRAPADAALRAPVATPLNVAPGDVVCILGSGWDTPQTVDALTALTRQGARIAVLIHDVIPLKLPGMVHGNPAHFLDWLTRMAGLATIFLANSQATARDLAQVQAEQGWSVPIHVTPLAQATVSGHIAAEVGKGLSAERHRRADIRDVAKLPYALCVGTMAAHKNNWRLAQAWARLAQEDGVDLPRLVLAGKRGWLNDDFFRAFDATGGWGGWVQIVEQPGDDDLEYLYRHCVFTTMPSLYEGWGLPVGEGLAYGKTGLVSAVTSLPEVGGELVEYCDPASISSISKGVRRLCDPAHRQALEDRIAATDLRDWAAVGADVAGALQDDSPEPAGEDL